MKAALRAIAVLAVVTATSAQAGEDRPQRSACVSLLPNRRGSSESPHIRRSSVAAITTHRRSRSRIADRFIWKRATTTNRIGARSAFVGWTFSGGDSITWELTPLLGGAWGSVHAFVPGVEASLGWRQFDFYIEGEYVHDNAEHSSSYWYAWSELGFRPVEWLRIGVVGQRTRAYGGDRDIQRGPFAQLTWRSVTIGGYWFNPGSSDQVVVTSIGVTF